MIRRLRTRERGFAMPMTLAVLFISLMLGIPAMTLTLGSLDRVTQDRRDTRALEAADAGADVAVWRMNKIIAPAEASGLVSSTLSVVSQTACVNIDVAGTKLLALGGAGGSGWCAATPWETLDDASPGPKQETSYQVSIGIHISTDPTSLLERKVVATGRVGGVTRRVMLTLRVDPNLSTLALFRRYRYAVCSGRQTGSSPDSGCPS